MRQKSRAEAAKEAIGSQAKHATENVGILDALAMVRFVESPYVGSTILGGYQRNLNKQGNVQIPVVVRFVRVFSVKLGGQGGQGTCRLTKSPLGKLRFVRGFSIEFDW